MHRPSHCRLSVRLRGEEPTLIFRLALPLLPYSTPLARQCLLSGLLLTLILISRLMIQLLRMGGTTLTYILRLQLGLAYSRTLLLTASLRRA